MTVFEQISNSYQKLLPPTPEPPVDVNPVEVPTTTHTTQPEDGEEPQPQDAEEDYEHELDDHETPPPVPTVRELNSMSLRNRECHC